MAKTLSSTESHILPVALGSGGSAQPVEERAQFARLVIGFQRAGHAMGHFSHIRTENRT